MALISFGDFDKDIVAFAINEANAASKKAKKKKAKEEEKKEFDENIGFGLFD